MNEESQSKPPHPAVSHEWTPIQELPANWREFQSIEFQNYRQIWFERRKALEGSSALRDFNTRLARRWAIETGIIEGVYDIDRGTTEQLILHGFGDALIDSRSIVSSEGPVAQILRDHQSTLDGVFDFVSQRRELSTSYIKELHQELLRHQDFTEAKNQFGKLVKLPLLKGEWKRNPNNPLRADGKLHEYCPPVHVQAEMDRLVALHVEHLGAEVAPEIEAAWLHHRFAQIHPFQDGNGRVARAMATLVLLRANCFPFVVDRSERASYIDALERADTGSLEPLVAFITKQQRAEFQSALQLSADAMTGTGEFDNGELVRLLKQKQDSARQARSDFAVLGDFLVDQIEKVFQAVLPSVADQLKLPITHKVRVGQSGEEEWYRTPVLLAVKSLGYETSLGTFHRWVRVRLTGFAQTGRTQTILISIHPFGKEYVGLARIVALLLPISHGVDLEEAHALQEGELISIDPFELYHKEPNAQVHVRFRTWLLRAVNVGLGMLVQDT